MNRKSLVLVALAICLLPAVARADSRGHGHRGHHSGRGFNFSIGFGGHHNRGSFGYGSYGHHPSVSFGYYHGGHYSPPSYYRTRYYYRPVVERYYDEPYYDYRPRVRYSRNYYYEQPIRSYYPRRYYRYCD